MVKQRRESISMYEQGGRQDLADVEASEIAVIEDFLPAQLGEAEATAAIAAIVAELGATSLKDMGRVMAAVKDRHGSQLAMSKASGWVKAALSCDRRSPSPPASGRGPGWTAKPQRTEERRVGKEWVRPGS